MGKHKKGNSKYSMRTQRGQSLVPSIHSVQSNSAAHSQRRPKDITHAGTGAAIVYLNARVSTKRCLNNGDFI